MNLDEKKLKNLLMALTLYYGFWQSIHLLGNLAAFLISMDNTRNFLGGTMNNQEFKALLASGVIDLLVASPLGIAFAVGYHRGRRWSIPVGIISLTISMYSAYLYVYLHVVYQSFVFVPLDFVLLWVLFLPCMLLFVLLPYLLVKNGVEWLFEEEN